MVKSSRRSRTRHSRKRTHSTRRRHSKKVHHRRRRSTRKTRGGGGTRCFDARGNPDSDGLYNVDGSRNSNCPN